MPFECNGRIISKESGSFLTFVLPIALLILFLPAGLVHFLFADSYLHCEVVNDELVTSDDDGFIWGYLGGAKQPIGSFFDGVSVHQVIKPDQESPAIGGTLRGYPNYMLYVDENGGTVNCYVIATPCTTTSSMSRPSCVATFGPNGKLWYTNGGKNVEPAIPFDPWDLFSGTFDTNEHSFTQTLELENFIPDTGTDDSNAPSGGCLHASDDNLLFFWRNGASTHTDTTIRFRKSGLDLPDFHSTLDLGTGSVEVSASPISHYYSSADDQHVDITIEQLWTKYDPRWYFTLVTWQCFIKWKTGDPENPLINCFGSCPFIYRSDDDETWKLADGTVANGSLAYPNQTPPTIREVIMPDDHLEGADCFSQYSLIPRSLNLTVNDLGVAPGEVGLDAPIFWMVMPKGFTPLDSDKFSQVNFWYYNSGNPSAMSWTCTPLSLDNALVGETDSKSFACGVTKDYLVFVYAVKYGEDDQRNILKAKIGKVVDETGDIIWTAAENLLEINENPGEDYIVNWVSFVQPAAGYADNCARFFYSYSIADPTHPAQELYNRQYGNKIRWAKLRVQEGTLDAELTCTPALGTLPFSSIIRCQVFNEYNFIRKANLGLDVTTGGGRLVHYRQGYANIAAHDSLTQQFPIFFPSLYTVIGDNILQLFADDVTPPPYNQPPYWPSGDTAMDACTITGMQP